MSKLGGSFARFKQRPDDKPNDVEGWANKIVVNQKTNMLTLTGQAALRQGGDTVRGDEIIYNMSTDTLKVRGGAAVGVSNNPNSTVKADPIKSWRTRSRSLHQAPINYLSLPSLLLGMYSKKQAMTLLRLNQQEPVDHALLFSLKRPKAKSQQKPKKIKRPRRPKIMSLKMSQAMSLLKARVMKIKCVHI